MIFQTFSQANPLPYYVWASPEGNMLPGGNSVSPTGFARSRKSTTRAKECNPLSWDESATMLPARAASPSLRRVSDALPGIRLRRLLE